MIKLQDSTEVLAFVVPGEPKAEARHRMTLMKAKDGRTFMHSYEPMDSKNQKAFIKMLAIKAMQDSDYRRIDDGPVGIKISCYMPIPKSAPKKFVSAAKRQEELPCKKPDLDNIYKLLTDALNGLVYADDKQICYAEISKAYSDQPRTEAEIWRL